MDFWLRDNKALKGVWSGSAYVHLSRLIYINFNGRNIKEGVIPAGSVPNRLHAWFPDRPPYNVMKKLRTKKCL